MGNWISKVLSKIKKIFEKNSTQKAAAEQACKSFDDSKETINKEFEEKKAELQPKVIEIFEASSTEIKTIVKERKDAGIKKNSAAVHNFLEELVKIDFPGSKQVYEASSKYGPMAVSGPIVYVFEMVYDLFSTEEKEVQATISEASKEKEIGVEEEEEKEKNVEEKNREEEIEKEKSEIVMELVEPSKVKEEEEIPKP
ncbi:plasma membrane-associated cation-binding protein 1-like [Magnolia sinica]|uniref:plasma membrane-associated cation-binding protein 1-like n=1 Tax=Magnolia sinica TaxID=86752 RepID=UPI002659ACBA|nr:plasma membrane-associated cation-binding protein 1-like [Magnolia sinica]